MEVNTGHISSYLVETDVVKSLKACARDRPHAMVRDEEVFFPPHKYMLPLGKVSVGEIGPLCLLRQRSPRGESGPMMHVGFLRSSPRFIPSLEGVFGADNLSFEKGRQSGVIFREACAESHRLDTRGTHRLNAQKKINIPCMRRYPQR